MKTKTRRTESEWLEIHEGWEQSGKTQIEFCRETGIPITSFTRWRTKIKNKNDKESGLVKLEKKKEFALCNILIQTSYCKIAISGNENPQTLSNLFRAIRRAEYAD